MQLQVWERRDGRVLVGEHPPEKDPAQGVQGGDARPGL